MAEGRDFHKTAYSVAAVDGRLRQQPAGPGTERVEGRVVSGGGQYEVDIGGQTGWQPVESVGTVIQAEQIQSVHQHHKRSISGSHLDDKFHR